MLVRERDEHIIISHYRNLWHALSAKGPASRTPLARTVEHIVVVKSSCPKRRSNEVGGRAERAGRVARYFRLYRSMHLAHRQRNILKQ